MVLNERVVSVGCTVQDALLTAEARLQKREREGEQQQQQQQQQEFKSLQRTK